MKIIYKIFIAILITTMTTIILFNIVTANTRNELLEKNILILHSDEEFMPANVDINSSLLQELKGTSKFEITIYSEYLDLARQNSENLTEQYTAIFLEKYKNIKIDAIISVDYKAFNFLKNNVGDLFKSVPIVFCMIPEGLIDESTLDSNYTGNYLNIDASASVDIIRYMHPNAKEVVIVSGSGKADVSKLNEIKKDLSDYKYDIKISYLENKTMDDFLKIVSNLSDDNIILYNAIFEDKNGDLFIPRESLKKISNYTSVPIYGLFYTNLNYGLVGGSLFEFKEVAMDAAEKTLLILDGVSPSELSMKKVTNKVYFNWLLLEKWNINEKDIPDNSILLNKEYTTWELYKFQIISVILFIILESMLILYLITQLKLRKKAEENLKIFNNKLETKVEERTELLNELNHGLKSKNEELESEILIRIDIEKKLKITVDTLTDTQEQLIIAEKNTTINHLVQNVLHRVNTPLGNLILCIDYMGNQVEYKNKKHNIVENLMENSKMIVSTMETLRAMLDVNIKEKSVKVNLENYMETILYGIFMKYDSKTDKSMLICYPKEKVWLQKNNFKKIILSLSEFARSQRIINPKLERAELIFYIEEDKIVLIYKDHALDTFDNLYKVFDPYYFNSFRANESGLELAVLYNVVTVGVKGNISIVEDLELEYSKVIKIEIFIND